MRLVICALVVLTHAPASARQPVQGHFVRDGGRLIGKLTLHRRATSLAGTLRWSYPSGTADSSEKGRIPVVVAPPGKRSIEIMKAPVTTITLKTHEALGLPVRRENQLQRLTSLTEARRPLSGLELFGEAWQRADAKRFRSDGDAISELGEARRGANTQLRLYRFMKPGTYYVLIGDAPTPKVTPRFPVGSRYEWRVVQINVLAE